MPLNFFLATAPRLPHLALRIFSMSSQQTNTSTITSRQLRLDNYVSTITSRQLRLDTDGDSKVSKFRSRQYSSSLKLATYASTFASSLQRLCNRLSPKSFRQLRLDNYVSISPLPLLSNLINREANNRPIAATAVDEHLLSTQAQRATSLA